MKNDKKRRREEEGNWCIGGPFADVSLRLVPEENTVHEEPTGTSDNLKLKRDKSLTEWVNCPFRLTDYK